MPRTTRHTFALTYEVVTPESAEHGDAADRGYEVEPAPIVAPFSDAASVATYDLRQAIDVARSHGATCPSDGHRLEHVGAHTWFYDPDGSTCFRTGASTRYAAHFGGVTASTMRRIARLLAQ